MHAHWQCVDNTRVHTQLVKAYDKLLTQYNRDLGFELTLVR